MLVRGVRGARHKTNNIFIDVSTHIPGKNKQTKKNSKASLTTHEVNVTGLCNLPYPKSFLTLDLEIKLSRSSIDISVVYMEVLVQCMRF